MFFWASNAQVVHGMVQSTSRMPDVCAIKLHCCFPDVYMPLKGTQVLAIKDDSGRIASLPRYRCCVSDVLAPLNIQLLAVLPESQRSLRMPIVFMSLVMPSSGDTYHLTSISKCTQLFTQKLRPRLSHFLRVISQPGFVDLL